MFQGEMELDSLIELVEKHLLPQLQLNFQPN